jgi:hypothetical protein
MPSLPSFDSDFQSLVRWEVSAMAPPIPIGKGRLKELKALGHKVDRFLAARSACWKHADKDAPGILAPWMKPEAPAPGELAGDGLFACHVLMKGEGFHLPQPILESEMAGRLALLWQRCDPAAPRTLPPALAVPSDARAPLWLALLRLRPLRELWERELRRSTLESLLGLLPDAWVLDPTPLPPGSVIPRLELASWRDLTRRRSSGRQFVIVSAQDFHDGVALDENASRTTWSAAIQHSLDTFESEPRVLMELTSDTESPAWIIAFYEKRSGRVDSIGAMALTNEADGKFVPAALTP